MSIPLKTQCVKCTESGAANLTIGCHTGTVALQFRNSGTTHRNCGSAAPEYHSALITIHLANLYSNGLAKAGLVLGRV